MAIEKITFDELDITELVVLKEVQSDMWATPLKKGDTLTLVEVNISSHNPPLFVYIVNGNDLECAEIVEQELNGWMSLNYIEVA